MTTQISKKQWLAGGTLLGAVLIFGFMGIASNANEGSYLSEHEEHEHREHEKHTSRSSAEQDTVYIEECGACHLAYPPGLLPAESWRAIMAGLADHFGENAESDSATVKHIASYLDRQSAQQGERSSMRKMLRNMPDNAPLRVTALPYFIHKHDEVPERMVKNNPEVGSFSQCDSCHKDAVKGVFDEDRVFIPGFGRWDD